MGAEVKKKKLIHKFLMLARRMSRRGTCLALGTLLMCAQAGAFFVPLPSVFLRPLPARVSACSRTRTLMQTTEKTSTIAAHKKPAQVDEVNKYSADTHPPYGETGGAMLLMEDVLISRGTATC